MPGLRAAPRPGPGRRRGVIRALVVFSVFCVLCAFRDFQCVLGDFDGVFRVTAGSLDDMHRSVDCRPPRKPGHCAVLWSGVQDRNGLKRLKRLKRLKAAVAVACHKPVELPSLGKQGQLSRRCAEYIGIGRRSWQNNMKQCKLFSPGGAARILQLLHALDQTASDGECYPPNPLPLKPPQSIVRHPIPRLQVPPVSQRVGAV